VALGCHVQIAFRLAARLGHAAVHAIDDDSFLDLNDSLRVTDQRRPEFERTRATALLRSFRRDPTRNGS